jgi:proteic killer suppression protein
MIDVTRRRWQNSTVIRTFASKETQTLYEGGASRRFEAIRRQAIKRLDRIASAQSLSLAALPGNRLEALAGDRKGQHSIRINDQWRICFVWRADGAYGVEIVDYH